MKRKNLSRRNFLRNTSIGSAGIILAPTILKSCAPGETPNDRINIAHIGVGSRWGQEMNG